MSGGAESNKGGEGSIRNDEVLRVVLVGKTGNGKSATGNTILGSRDFVSRASPASVTISCQEAKGVVNFRPVSVVDTPGLFDTLCSDKDKTFKEISDCIKLAAPGPHAILVVIKLDRFTDEEQKSVELIQELFGQNSNEYTMILFTNLDRLEEVSVDDFLKESQKLQACIRKCNGRYHVFNNKTKEPSQVNELLEKITNMLDMNGGSHYTNEMFQEAAREMEREKERQISAEREEEKREKDRLVSENDAKWEKIISEDNKDMVKVFQVFTAATSAAVAAGGAIGGGVAIATAVEAGALVGGPIGAAAGAVVGVGIGAGYYGYRQYKKHTKKASEKKEPKDSNTSEEKEPLISDEQSTK